METKLVEARWEDWYSQYRSFLTGLAYQMLGTLHEAEDIVQETFLQARAYISREIDNPKALLAKIATNRCLDTMKSARWRNERGSGTWLPELLPVDSPVAPIEEQVLRNDRLSIAAFLLMEALPPIDRAVYVLREVFEWNYKDISKVVDRTELACRKIYSRAKSKVGRDPEVTMVSRPMKPFVTCLLYALSEGDLAPFVRLLSQDVVLYTDRGPGVRTATNPIVSSGHVAAYLHGLLNITARTLGPLRFELVATNGGPALLAESDGELQGILALEVKATLVRSIFIIRNPDKLGPIADAYGLKPFQTIAGQ
ncbi:sigma factor [Paenibacillus antri]|nr:sigma factor [Paenibacillus antri]